MNDLEKALELRQNGEVEESNKLLLKLAEAEPQNPQLQYQYAWSCDILGREKEAVSYYEKAIDLGLSDEELRGALLGLGSTYRTLGAYVSSKATLEKALSVFPEDGGLKIFYAMTLYNLGEHDKAMEILLKLLGETSSDSSVQEYKKAILFYADKLNIKW